MGVLDDLLIERKAGFHRQQTRGARRGDFLGGALIRANRHAKVSRRSERKNTERGCEELVQPIEDRRLVAPDGDRRLEEGVDALQADGGPPSPKRASARAPALTQPAMHGFGFGVERESGTHAAEHRRTRMASGTP